MEKIKLDYFYNLFRKDYEKSAVDYLYSKNNEEVFDEVSIYYSNLISREERIRFFDESLLYVCKCYIALSKSSVEAIGKAFETVSFILNAMEENEYQKSFLFSLMSILNEYLICLDKGRAILSSTKGAGNKEYRIILDSDRKIREMNDRNMSQLEATQTMLRVLTLERNGGIGPIPNVVYKYDKNMY